MYAIQLISNTELFLDGIWSEKLFFAQISVSSVQYYCETGIKPKSKLLLRSSFTSLWS